VLLPTASNHDVMLFEDVEAGRWIDCTPRAPGNLLPPPEPFVGRNKEVYDAVCFASNSRLSMITGLPGSGKSAVASAAGNILHTREDFSRGVFWVDVSNCKKVADLESCISEVLLSKSGKLSLSDVVCNGKALIILDGCEHLMLEGSSNAPFRRFLREFLLRFDTVSLLLTARRGLSHVQGVGFRVLQIEPLSQRDSASLLLQLTNPKRLSALHLNAEVVHTWEEALAAVMRLTLVQQQLRGNPHLIELCASLLNEMTATTLELALQKASPFDFYKTLSPELYDALVAATNLNKLASMEVAAAAAVS